MNLGIDLNIQRTVACYLASESDGLEKQFITIENTITFSHGNIVIGNAAKNVFYSSEEAVIFSLSEIVSFNGVIINKDQISVERCLSLLLGHLLEKVREKSGTKVFSNVCVSIPYGQYYYWREIVLEAFNLIGIQQVRIISQPTAFFASRDNFENHFRLFKSIERGIEKQFNEKITAYRKKALVKRVFSKKPQHLGAFQAQYYYTFIFLSAYQDGISVSKVNYIVDSLVIEKTGFYDTVSEKSISDLAVSTFVENIEQLGQGYKVRDQKTLLRVSDLANEMLRAPDSFHSYEIVLPYVLCNDGSYKTIRALIDLTLLKQQLSPLVESINRLIKQCDTKEYLVIHGDILGQGLFYDLLEKKLLESFHKSKIFVGQRRAFAQGAYEYSNVLARVNKDYLSVEAIPFSVLVRLRNGELIELIYKDWHVPTISHEHVFEVIGSGRSKWVEVLLITKEGNAYQSLSVWKVKIDDNKAFAVIAEVETNMGIKLRALAAGCNLEVVKVSTFSFSGAGFEIGIKGKDIRQYILNQFNYLGVVFKDQYKGIFEPYDKFYELLQNGELFTALRMIGATLKLSSLPDINFSESSLFEEKGVAGFIAGKKISIPKKLQSNPHGLGYVIAHELAHYILIQQEGIFLESEQENEILTEIFVIFTGMGKLFLNGYYSAQAKEFTLGSLGYLDQKIIHYIHQIYFEKFGIEKKLYRENLSKEGRHLLE